MNHLRTKPTLRYGGLTIIISNPSRFDTNQRRLLSAGAGLMMNNFCLRPDLNLMQCDIRVADDESLLLPNTRCILLLGEYAMHKWLPETRLNTLNEMRGSLFYINNIPTICSYYPQDACDIKNYERDLNPEHKTFEDEESEKDDEGDNAKAFSKTKRSNYAFWLKADCGKVKTILKSGVPAKWYPEPTYKIYPNSKEVIDVLINTRNGITDFDMETNYENQDIECFAFSVDNGKIVYSVPVLNFNYAPAYSNGARILAALALHINRNTLVAHNGSSFDFLVLAIKLRIAISKVYDTMTSFHRCFPDIEKSLGHFTSYWTWEKFHKDEDSRGYRTSQQMMDRLKYCGKDVFTMSIGRQMMQQYTKTIPGLENSINTVNSQIKPYLTTTLQGIKVNYDDVIKRRRENDRLMMQYNRMIELLIGQQGMRDVRSCVKKAKAFSNSNKQCCEYFHTILGYPIVGRSKPDKKGIRNPSLAALNMYKLKLQHNNPVIDFTIAYRQTRLETTTPLGFTPWRDDNNNIINYNKWIQEHQ